ncbi:MAG: hypothetical protein RI967_535 [Planctomycetota bacterium]
MPATSATIFPTAKDFASASATSSPTTRAAAPSRGDASLPPPEQLARADFEIVVRRLADDIAFGSDASKLVGSGLEYAGSRPYVPGDSVRLLNWRLTARTGRPFVREYEALKRTSVHLVVDTSASMAVRSGARSKLDLAIWIAAALGLVAQRRMSPVAVVGAGERRTVATPTLSRTELRQAIEPLRRHDLDEGTTLAARLREAAGRATRAGVFVVLSDLHDPGAVAAIREACQRHDVAVIRLADAIETRALGAGFVRAREAETGRTFLASSRTRLAADDELRRTLLRAGADCLELATDRPFIPALRHFLAFRGAAARGRG